MTARLKAVEFFSGIGAFAYACREEAIEVIAAFDQGQDANRVYEYNFGLRPNTRNLDSIPPSEIPDADIWWMSPPCTPYTVRGPQRDDADFRAQSLARLIELLSDKLPPVLFVENVFAFLQSTMHARLLRRLAVLGYNLREETMCPTRFGIPMKRPRIFLTAVREGIRFADLANPDGQPQPMSGFIEEQRNDKLVVSDESFARYREGMHIIDPHDPNAYAICFTSGYGKSFKSSGSLLQQDNVVRHFSPREILSLMGFESDFRFPPDMDLRTCWRLVGNSVDIRCIRRVLGSVERKSNWVKSQHDSSTHR